MNDLLISKNKTREHQITTDRNGILYLMDHYLKDKNLYLKDYKPKTLVYTQRLANGHYKLFFPANVQVKDSLYLYSIIQKYIEIEMRLIEPLNNGKHIYEPVKVNIALSSRKNPRFDVMDDSIILNEFKIFQEMNKDQLDPRNLTIGIKNFYMECQKKLSTRYPNVRVFTLDSKECQDDPLTELIFTKKQALYIENTQNPDSYFVHQDKLINYGLLLGDEVDSVMARFKKSKIASLFLYPILYQKLGQRDIVFGYIKIWSEQQPILLDQSLAHLDETTLELLENIELCRKLRTVKTTQNLVDISEGGLKMKVTDPQLISHFLANPELILTLQFKLSNNIINVNLQGEVVGHFADKDNRYNACIAFSKSNKRQLTKLKKCLQSWQTKPKAN